MQQQAAINTSEVLKAAQNGALDSSLAKVAELVDDLDARPANKVGDRVLSNNPNAMGSYAKFGFKSYELDPELGTAQFWEKKL